MGKKKKYAAAIEPARTAGSQVWRWAVVAICGALVITAALYLGHERLDAFRATLQFGTAVKLLESGQTDLARSALRKALALDPWQRDARLRLAELELRQNRLEHAFLEFQTLAELHPADPAGWKGLARTWLAAEMLESAETAATRAIEAGHDSPDSGAYLLRAEIRDRIGRRFGALLDARRAFALAPDDVLARSMFERVSSQPATPAGLPPAPVARDRFWPGRLAQLVQAVLREIQQKNWTAAQALSDSALRDYPGTLMASWLAGVAAYSQGQFVDAERHLLTALALAPRSSRVATNLAGAWAKQKGPVFAGEQLLALHAHDRGFLVPLDIAASAYLEARQPAKAEEALKLGVAEAAPQTQAFRQLANFYRQLDRLAEAQTVCEEGLRQFPGHLELALCRAELLSVLGNTDAAIRSFEEILTRQPDAMAARSALARLLMNRDDPDSRSRALELVRGLKADSPTDAGSQDVIGWVLLRHGDPREARDWLNSAARMAPEDPAIRYHFGAALVRLKQTGAAWSELRAALDLQQPFAERPDAQRLLRSLEQRH